MEIRKASEVLEHSRKWAIFENSLEQQLESCLRAIFGKDQAQNLYWQLAKGKLKSEVKYRGSCFAYVASLVNMCDIGQQV